MDITPLFNEALAKYEAPVIPLNRKPSPPVDEFLKEAYRIESHISSLTRYLLSVRQSYLSTSKAPPSRLSSRLSSSSLDDSDRKFLTDKQRDEIDAEAKSTIRQSINVIQNLESAEKIRIETEKMQFRKRRRKNLGWRAILLDEDEDQPDEDETMKTIRVHREGVIWLLRNRLEKASEVQREQQETRVMRQVERSKSMLYKATGSSVAKSEPSQSRPTSSAGRKDGGASLPSNGGLPADEQQDIESFLSPEQLQIFEKENQELMNYYETTLDQVRTAERSLIEISELHSQLATHLTTQQTFLDQLVLDSITTHENVEKGNKQLKEAAERSTWASNVFYGAVTFSFFIVVYDFLV